MKHIARTTNQSIAALALFAGLGFAAASTAYAAPPPGGLLGYPDGFTMPGPAIGGYAGAVGGSALIVLDDKSPMQSVVLTSERSREALRPADLRSDPARPRKNDTLPQQ